jgi:hypothetical protein
MSQLHHESAVYAKAVIASIPPTFSIMLVAMLAIAPEASQIHSVFLVRQAR